MISYPADILRRFGRYEAVEDLGLGLAGARFWRAWDPFLDRFVLVAALLEDDPAVYANVRAVCKELSTWSGEAHRCSGEVLDFSPASEDGAAFFVLGLTDQEDPQAAIKTPFVRRQTAVGGASPGSYATPRILPMVLIGAAFVFGGFAVWMFTPDGSTPEPTVLPRTVVVRAERPRQPPPAAVAQVPEVAPPHPVEVAARTQQTPAQDEQQPGSRNAVAATPVASAPGNEIERPQDAPSNPDDKMEPSKALAGSAEPTAGNAGATGAGAPTPTAAAARFDLRPAPGRIEVLTGNQTEFRIGARDDAGIRYEWQRDQDAPVAGKVYRFQTDFLDSAGQHRLSVTAVDATGSAVQSAEWTVEVVVRNRPPTVQIVPRKQPVAGGEEIKIAAKVKDPDQGRGDRVECEWSVDGQPLQRYCDELTWVAPKVDARKTVKIALQARDRQDASASGQVAVVVEPPVAASSPPTAVPARVAPAPVDGKTDPVVVEAPREELTAEDSARQAIANYFKQYEARVRGEKQGAKVRFEIVKLTLQGDRGSAVANRTVELPSQAPQDTQKTLELSRKGSSWAVEEQK